jgi:hypothetical protein
LDEWNRSVRGTTFPISSGVGGFAMGYNPTLEAKAKTASTNERDQG